MREYIHQRVSELQNLLPRDSVFFISNPSDIFYLTGQDLGSDGFLLLTSKKAFFISDSRYREELQMASDFFIPVEIELNLFKTVAMLLPDSINVVFVQGPCQIRWVEELQKTSSREIRYSLELDNKIRYMRAIKNEQEIKILRQNFSIHRQVLTRWQEGILGKSEKDAKNTWICLVHEFGAEGVSFDAIVAVGPSASRPHYKAGKRRITGRVPLLFDSGLKRSGYCTDLTRIFFVDRMNHRQRRLFELVKEAQELAISSIRPGISAKDLDRLVRDFFRRYGVDRYFIHGLGHGLGIDVHESPTISSRSSDELKPGMVFTIEPGLYIEGKFGVRIEDVVVVTQKGCKVISR